MIVKTGSLRSSKTNAARTHNDEVLHQKRTQNIKLETHDLKKYCNKITMNLINDNATNTQKSEAAVNNNVTEPKNFARMQRRNSLTLSFRQEDDSEHVVDEELPVRSREAPLQEGSTKLRASSEPLLDLGDLASLLMPPKVVNNERYQVSSKSSYYIAQRRGSC